MTVLRHVPAAWTSSDQRRADGLDLILRGAPDRVARQGVCGNLQYAAVLICPAKPVRLDIWV